MIFFIGTVLGAEQIFEYFSSTLPNLQRINLYSIGISVKYIGLTFMFLGYK
jgi:hypothetical protein